MSSCKIPGVLPNSMPIGAVVMHCLPHCCSSCLGRPRSACGSVAAGGYGGMRGDLALDPKEECIQAPRLHHVLCTSWRNDNSGVCYVCVCMLCGLCLTLCFSAL